MSSTTVSWLAEGKAEQERSRKIRNYIYIYICIHCISHFFVVPYFREFFTSGLLTLIISIGTNENYILYGVSIIFARKN